MIKFFGKKEEEPQKEAQAKRPLLRGPNGKFISRKKPQAAKPAKGGKKAADKKTAKVKPSMTVTFYGREINKVYDGKNWYFNVNDLVALAAPPPGKERVRKKTSFEKTLKTVSTIIEGIVYADADSCLRLIKEVEGNFPGPLARWLTETASLPYEEPAEERKDNGEPEQSTSNPSDRR